MTEWRPKLAEWAEDHALTRGEVLTARDMHRDIPDDSQGCAYGDPQADTARVDP